MFRVKTAKLKRSVNTALYDTYMDYVTQTILVSHIWQKRFVHSFEGETSWSCDFDAQVLTLGESTYPISFLGTESYVDHTWFWAWANQSGLDPSLYQEASQLQFLGEQKQISEFQAAILPLTSPKFGGTGMLDGSIISGIVSVFHRPPCCYYKIPYEQGTAFLLLHDVPNEVFQAFQVEEVMKGIREIIQRYPINHRSLIQGFCVQARLKITETEHKICVFLQEAVLHIEMDEQDRIKEMSVLASVEQKK